MRSRVARGAMLGAAAMLIAGCATLPRLEAPSVFVERVRVDRFSGVDAQFTVVLNVANPNDREIAVDAIDADLRIEGVPVGRARLALPVRLPARGATTAALTARAGLADTLRAAAEIARRAEAAGGALAPVRYAVSGTATIDGGRTIPFARSGEIPWPRNAATPQ
jgi:LEA14-like dessication related protein